MGIRWILVPVCDTDLHSFDILNLMQHKQFSGFQKTGFYIGYWRLMEDFQNNFFPLAKILCFYYVWSQSWAIKLIKEKFSISFHACDLNLENLVNSSCWHVFSTIVCIHRGTEVVYHILWNWNLSQETTLNKWCQLIPSVARRNNCCLIYWKETNFC